MGRLSVALFDSGLDDPVMVVSMRQVSNRNVEFVDGYTNRVTKRVDRSLRL